MPREYKRSDRVADFIKRELSILLQQELRDPRVGTAIINEVTVSRDIAHAKVYVTFLGVDDAEQAAEPIAVLNGAAGFLRTQMASKSRMRSTPKLHFVFDQSVRTAEYLSNLIDSAVASDGPQEK
ncbi:30S ribosome-binding factor RbfA [Pseudomonadales bacterium]|nr:30S ribosome-binding factor RbfA [Pseudomonadales bacterium]MDB4542479.1 30S ribosome-binding factor RbfA [Pseudomonadales bacterium]